MSEAADLIVRELDLCGEAGTLARFWLRDDDAIEPTPALDAFIAHVEAFRIPLLLAVIPAHAKAGLAARIAPHALIKPAQHGWSHANHSPQGQKPCEFGATRPLNLAIADIAAGKARMRELFGAATSPVFVPPWNRIAADVARALPGLGFTGLSTFGPAQFGDVAGLAEVNTHVDIIDWKGGRKGRPFIDLAREVAASLSSERLAAERTGGGAIGILTHHLVHDAAANAFLHRFCRIVGDHPAAIWVDVGTPAAS